MTDTPESLALRLARAAAKATGDDEGRIWLHDTYISAGDVKSPNADTRRERARQIAAIDYLLSKKYVETSHGTLHSLTYAGYVWADTYP
jgi:hypothetical protein